jgi:CobQ-like glutamine amidotransferase family enzyme
MSIYGDMGNIIAIKYRLEKIGFDVIYQQVELGENFPAKTDFYFMGGGQDKEQYLIYQDLNQKSLKLVSDIQDGVSMLAICGGYQLLGEKFLTGEGVEIPGIGVFPVTTKAPDSSVKSRCIGNIIVKSNISALQNIFLVGFENHSGQTYFTGSNNAVDARPIGQVVLGFGNNSTEKLEGCVYKNAVGTYMHGSCLPKNPELADYLIKKALERKMVNGELSVGYDISTEFEKIDDTIALIAKNAIIKRFAPQEL